MTPACDIADENALATALADCAKSLPPIAGCIQGAMVLRDTILSNMSFDNWQTATRSEIQGSWNLHTLLPSGMDFFLCLSSLTSIIGNGGQANHSAGNAFMDELVRHRLAKGENALTVNLGWVDIIGAAANRSNTTTLGPFNRIGGLPRKATISPAELQALFDYCCDPSRRGRFSSPSQILVGLRITSEMIASDAVFSEFPWLLKPTFTHMVHAARQGGKGSAQAAKGTDVNYAAMFRDAPSTSDAVQIVLLSLRDRLSKALSVQPADGDLFKPLHAAGVDSLQAVELKNYLAKHFESDIAVFDLLGMRSVEEASILVVKRSGMASKLESATANE